MAAYALTTFGLPAGAYGGSSGQTSLKLFVNDSGEVAGQYNINTGNSAFQHGFLYSNGVFSTVDPSASTKTVIAGLTNDGEMAGSYYTGATFHPFVFDGTSSTTFTITGSNGSGGPLGTGINAVARTGYIAGAAGSYTPGVDAYLYNHGTLTTFDPLSVSGGYDQASDVTVYAVSSNGIVGGTYDGLDGTVGFLHGAGTTSLFVAGQSSSFVTAVNKNGQAVGNYSVGGVSHGFFYDGTIKDIGLHTAPLSAPIFIGLNDAGQAAGYYQDTQYAYHGFFYANGTVTTFDPPGSKETHVTGLSGGGVVAGYYIDGNQNWHGFVDDNGAFTTIDVAGALATFVTSISNAGVIAGQYQDANDVLHGFVGTPTSPSTVSFQGSVGQYAISSTNGTITVADSVAGRDGTDLLVASPQLHFSDYTLVFDLNSAQDLTVYKIYQAAYGRTPDNGGFRYWAGVADATHISDVAMADNFLAAAEFTQLYGANPTNSTYVTGLYSHVLGRAPDPGGLAYWVGLADAGLARDQLLVAFAASAENATLIGSHVSAGYWTT